MDFLLKPFSFERFYKSVNKAKERLNIKSVTSTIPKITVKAEKKIYQVDLNNVLYVEACGDYTTVVCSDKKLTTHETLKNWEEKLGKNHFEKIHRSILINLQKLDHIEGNMAVLGKYKLTISEQYREKIIKILLDNNITYIG